jgi:hypothetical protein
MSRKTRATGGEWLYIYVRGGWKGDHGLPVLRSIRPHCTPLILLCKDIHSKLCSAFL